MFNQTNQCTMQTSTNYDNVISQGQIIISKHLNAGA